MRRIAFAGPMRRIAILTGATRRVALLALALIAIVGCGHPSLSGGDASSGGACRCRRHSTCAGSPSAWNPAHELVLAGTYDGTINTGSASLTSGNDTIFLASFTTSGTPAASRKLDDASTTATEWVHGVAIDSHGTAWVVGQYYGTPSFGDGALPFASQGGVLVLRLTP